MINLQNKNYDTVLSEASDYFKATGINMLGQQYGEIASNTALFENYVNLLTEGASANDAANMAQLMANNNVITLQEAQFSGIQAVASLSCPVIRKLWPKFAVKEAFKTEVAKTPRFVIPYTVPYMYKSSNPDQKVFLARGINPSSNAFNNDALNKEFTAGHVITVAAGNAKVVDFEYIGDIEEDPTAGKDPHVYIQDTPSQIKKQALDELFFEAYVIGDRAQTAELNKKYVAYDADFLVKNNDGYEGTDRDGLAIVSATTADELTALNAKGYKLYELVNPVKIGKRLGVYDSQTYAFDAGNGKKGQLMVKLEGKEAKATFVAIGGNLIITTYAAVCSEFNEEGWEFGFDIARQDIDISTGQAFNAPLPLAALQDMMAMYQIDGTKEIVEIMTNAFAQKVDKEGYDFIVDKFINQPANEAYFGDLGQYSAKDYTAVFDCMTPAWFSAGAKAWHEEIKKLIDLIAAKIKTNTYLQSGTFNLLCNPVDAMILANIDWQYRGGTGANMDGVDVDYSIGTYIGANTYKVISCPTIKQGAIYINFIPSADTQKTLTYYPYTFSTESGFVDPSRSRVPSIMMTKRHTFNEFMPATGCIILKNADGNWFQQSYATYKPYEA